MIKAMIFDGGGVLASCNTSFAAMELARKYDCDEKGLFMRIDSLESEYSTGQDCLKYYEIISKEFKIPKTVLHKSLNEDHEYLAFDIAKRLKCGHPFVSESGQPWLAGPARTLISEGYVLGSWRLVRLDGAWNWVCLGLFLRGLQCRFLRNSLL